VKWFDFDEAMTEYLAGTKKQVKAILRTVRRPVGLQGVAN
jgi:hypothetical protein